MASRTHSRGFLWSGHCLVVSLVLTCSCFMILWIFLTSIESRSNGDLLEINAKKILPPKKTLPPGCNLAKAKTHLNFGKKNEHDEESKAENQHVFHDQTMFLEDYKEMKKKFKIYAYPHEAKDEFANIFLPVDFKPSGNYASESYFKKALMQSHFITNDPTEADLFFLPFSIATMRHDSRVSVGGIKDFIKAYIDKISQKYPYWNRTNGADHFYVACHSVGRTATDKAEQVRLNAIQVVCSSSYFIPGYVAHKDVSLPQIWPREEISVGLASMESGVLYRAMEMERAEAQLKLYEMIISISKPMALRAVVLLNIPDIISTHGRGSNSLSVEEIASHMPHPPANLGILLRIMRFLASHGVFWERGDRYGLNDVSKLLVRENNESSLAPYLLFVSDKVSVAPWRHLHDTVVEDCSPFEKEYGMSSWEFASKNPKSAMTFHHAMASYANSVMPYVIEKYQGFKDIKTLVDVGGGVGSSLSKILSKHGHIHGINFDLPYVVASAPPIPGVEHVGGNMFEGVPAADAIFLKWILHNWDDEHCVTLLKKCYEAIPENGKLIIVESIVESQGSLRPLQLSVDMAMIFCTRGAKERTEEEFEALFQVSGFKSYKIIKLPFLESVIELSKL